MRTGSVIMRGGLACAAALGLAASAQAAEELSHAGVLSSYDGLAPAHTMQTRAEWRADADALKAARTVSAPAT